LKSRTLSLWKQARKKARRDVAWGEKTYIEQLLLAAAFTEKAA